MTTRTHAKAFICLALAGVALLAATVPACRRRGPDWRILQLYSGQTSVDLLQHPATVKMFRVGAESTAKADVHAGPYPAAGTPVDLPPEAAAELSALLVDPDSYDWQRMKKVPFRPQIGLWFVRGANVLEIAIDLDAAKMRPFAGTQPLGWQDIDPARARLLAIAKKAFPGDPVIDALK